MNVFVVTNIIFNQSMCVCGGGRGVCMGGGGGGWAHVATELQQANRKDPKSELS